MTVCKNPMNDPLKYDSVLILFTYIIIYFNRTSRRNITSTSGGVGQSYLPSGELRVQV